MAFDKEYYNGKKLKAIQEFNSKKHKALTDFVNLALAIIDSQKEFQDEIEKIDKLIAENNGEAAASSETGDKSEEEVKKEEVVEKGE